VKTRLTLVDEHGCPPHVRHRRHVNCQSARVPPPIQTTLTVQLALFVWRPQLVHRPELVPEVRRHALKVVRPVLVRSHVLRQPHPARKLAL
jgi:hypothetical protein